ncbi:unnamed protein product [Rhizophagus irregularis]|nr:unnamed protein product [Rhizophagus irregularis]
MLSAGENFQMIIFVGNGSFRKDFRRWLLQSSGRDILRFFRSLWTYEILFLTGLFNTKEHDHQDCLRHRLITAQRYRFLFLKSQYVNKPVKRLLYNHGLVSEEYGFSTPHYYNTIPTGPLTRPDGRPIKNRRIGLGRIWTFQESDQPWVPENVFLDQIFFSEFFSIWIGDRIDAVALRSV